MYHTAMATFRGYKNTYASGEISSSYIKVKHKARIKASCSSRELQAALQPQHHLQDQMQCHSLDLLFALTGTLADLEGTAYRSWSEEQQEIAEASTQFFKSQYVVPTGICLL